ncbi:hemagglutinin repeat-containing protein [Azotosporobacter soli]|uniref:hemagglutinin repeat-containing protein n=1 Tax=Azotosporobacter soli TaxID=3055040 RepID=UPI0031FE5BC9
MKAKHKGVGFVRQLAVWILILIFTTQPVLAATEVVVDPSNGKNPGVIQAPNGTTVVQILAPNANGLSHNQYLNLQVGPNGIIYNNGVGLVNTKLAGWITGNPNLRGGSAQIILNEVTGKLPTNLNGFQEIAGNRATLILANPNGIVGNGFGFINVNRAVLTTGTPFFGGSGSLEAFRVTGGQIAIEGSGLDASTTDRVDIIARSVNLNAQLNANELNIITGANQVNATNSQAAAISANPSEAKPAVALDVAALGGMYAGKITLVGTETGVGVNSQGTIQASGDIRLEQNGKINLTGNTTAGGNVQISGQSDVTNQGTLYAAGTTTINTQAALQNSGFIGAGSHLDLNGQTVQSTGALAAGVKQDKTLAASGNLTVTASNTLSLNGENKAAGNLSLTGANLNLAKANTFAGGDVQLTATQGDIDHSDKAVLQTSGNLTLTAKGTIRNDSGKLNAAGKLEASAEGAITNKDNGEIKSVQDMTLRAAALDNQNGTIDKSEAAGILKIDLTANLNNSAGKINSEGKLALTAGSITNPGNDMSAKKDFTLTVNGDFTNQGTLTSGETLTINAANLANAAQGKINAKTTNLTAAANLTNNGRIEGDQVEIKGQDVTNNATIIGNQVTINSNNLTNQGSQAVIGAAGTMNLWTKNTLTNQDNATIIALGDLNIAADQTVDSNGKLTNPTAVVTNQGAMIDAGKNLNITATQLNNVSSPVTIGTNTVQQPDKVLTRTPHFTYWAHYVKESPRLGTTEGEQLISYGDFEDRSTYTAYYPVSVTVPKDKVIAVDVSQSKVTFNDVPVTIPIIQQRPSAWTWNATVQYSDGRGPLDWPGKVAGQTTAYCNSMKVDANGNYVISFYPGYDPNLYLHPDKDWQKMTTYHCDSPINSRTTSTSIATEYISGTPVKGKLHVGQDFNLNIGQQFLNKYSEIAVGGAVNGQVANLQNQGYQLKQTTTSIVRSYFRGLFQTGGDGHTESSDGWQTTGPFVVTKPIGDGLPATFTAGSINLVGNGVANIQQRPDGTPGPQPGSTPTLNAPTFAAQHALTIVKPTTVDALQQGTGMNLGSLNGLYTMKKDPTAHFLVETDSRFANYQSFISSDYLLSALHLDPATTAKRIGDAFYEQQLVTQQVNQLTGRQFLTGYASADEEYKALLDHAAAEATAFNLTFGVALTKDQIAKLTSDMVWLVEQDVKLPDGSSQKALVPVVYLAQGNNLKLTDSGALIAADKIDIRLSGDLTNSGSILASKGIGKADTGNTDMSVAGASTYIEARDIKNQAGGKIGSEGLTNLNAKNDLLNQGGNIGGKQILAYAAHDIKNEAATSEVSASYRDASHNWSGSNTVVATGKISAEGDVKLSSGNDIALRGGSVSSASGNLTINAGHNLEIAAVQTHNTGSDRASNSAAYDHSDTLNVLSAVSGKNITLTSKNDTNLRGAQVSADDTLTVTANGNLNISAVKDIKTSAVRNNHNGSDYKENNYDETVIGTNLLATNNVSLNAVKAVDATQPLAADKGNINISGSSVASTKGLITVTADKDVTISEETEKHESRRELHNAGGGFLSSSKSDEVDHTLANLAVGSSLSGDRINVTANNNLKVQGSDVVGINDVTLTAIKGDVKLLAAQQNSQEEHYRHTESSGVFSTGGAGITIGSRMEEMNTEQKTLTNRGSLVGSEKGNLTITAGNKVDSVGTKMVSGLDTTITGKEVSIANSTDTSDLYSKYESKQSGLTVSVGGGIVDSVLGAYGNINAAASVKDERLKALYGYKAVQDLSKMTDPTKLTKVGVSISVGSSENKIETNIHNETTNLSNITAGRNVKITATEGDLNLTGTKIKGTDVTLESTKGNVNISAAQDKTQLDTKSTSSSWSVGGTIGVGFFGNFGSGNGKENGNTVTNVASQIDASGTATVTSGNDTNILGSKVKGDKVVVNVGGNLNIASQQDIDNYNAKNDSIGLGFTVGQKDGKDKSGKDVSNNGVTGSFNSSKTNSNYASVTNQAGIYAGQQGFTVTVGKNTDLKGAVIDSNATPEKNKLTTGTLTWSDIHNKAAYEASSFGVAYDSKKYQKTDTKNYKNQGLTPVIGPTVSGKADSTTTSAIALGTIEIKDKANQKQDLSTLSRDSKQSINALGKIFDKQTVEEQQQLIKLFGEVAYDAVGNMKLKEGSPEKAAVDMVVGGIMSQLGGGGFGQGAAAAGLSQLAMTYIMKIKDPAMQQWVSALIGAVASDLTGGSGNVGAFIALSQIRNNWLSHDRQELFAGRLKEALDRAKDTHDFSEVNKIMADYTNESQTNSNNNFFMREDIEDSLLTQLTRLAKMTGHSTDFGDLQGALNMFASTNLTYVPTITPSIPVHEPTPTPLETLENAIANGGNWNDRGQWVKVDGTVCTNLPGRGDYLISQGYKFEDRYNSAGTPCIFADGADWPVSGLPIKGDVLAGQADPTFVKINGQWSIVDPATNIPWYTTQSPPPGSAVEYAANFTWGVGVGLKNKADDVSQFLLTVQPKQIDAAILNGIQFVKDNSLQDVAVTVGGKMYQVTLEDWTRREAEIETITDPTEKGTKTAELAVDILATAAALRSAGKIAVSATDISVGNFRNAIGDGTGGVSNAIKFKDVKTFSAEETNQWFRDNVKPDYKPPYKPGTVVKEIELRNDTTFVRVYDNTPGGSGMYGGWVMKASDIEGLTAKQIQDKFALPNTPRYMCDVKLDAGTHVRVGEVNPLEGWGNGGGTQYDLIGKRVGNFTNERLLD